MKNVRIYKDDIRQNILKSMFVTDTTVFVGGGIIIAVLIYILLQYGLRIFNWNLYLSILVISEISFIATITHKIHNQPIYKVFPRFLSFKQSKKQYRQKELDPYLNEFIIQDNVILRKGKLIKVFEIEPYDVALLNNEDRENFYLKLKQMLHSLPSQVQFITRKETAKPEDYSNHFFSLYDRSDTKREPLIRAYVENLSDLIKAQGFVKTRHFAVFSTPGNSDKPTEKLKAMKKMHDIGVRFMSAIGACDISARPVADDELVKFMQISFR